MASGCGGEGGGVEIDVIKHRAGNCKKGSLGEGEKGGVWSTEELSTA